MAMAMAACGAAGVLMDVLSPSSAEKEQGATLALFVAAATTALGAGVFWLFGRKADLTPMRRREATLTVALVWGGASLFGALPFIFDADYSIVDSLFEAASGFTTTGATISTDIEGRLSRPLLLWRSLIQWLGGMGIVVLFVAVFPMLGVGGKHMFRSEVPGASAEGVRPRIAETSVVLWRLYLGLTLAEILALWLIVRIDLFEAICHAFTTMSTGGFSTRDASVAAFENPAVEMIITFFMLLAGVNFGLYYLALRGKSLKIFLRSFEFRVYIGLVLVTTGLLAFWIRVNHGNDPLESLRHAVFSIVTTITSTGYVTDDYMAYPPVGLALILILMFIGGSSGSTAGGMKVERVILLLKLGWAQIRKSFRPSMVQVVRMDHVAVDSSVLSDVAAFFIIYMLCLGTGTLAICVTDGVQVQTAFAAMLSCLSNMGPAPFYVGADNFASYSNWAKLVFTVAMVLGRLELFTIFALLVPDFWRR
jgi:trk system potassium uptake protein TrkH